MNGEFQPPSWDWLRAVLVSSFLSLGASGAILIPLSRLFKPAKLARLPNWLRWLLVLPVALVTGLIGEVIPRIVFAAIEVILNHELLFRPGVDSLIWQLWVPLLFVAGGVTMAPRYKFCVFLAVGGLKITVAATNLLTALRFVTGGGSWSTLDPVTNSPIWWNSVLYVACILVLGAFGIFLGRQSLMNKRERDDQQRPG
jgi:hypothetical protein